MPAGKGGRTDDRGGAAYDGSSANLPKLSPPTRGSTSGAGGGRTSAAWSAARASPAGSGASTSGISAGGSFDSGPANASGMEGSVAVGAGPTSAATEASTGVSAAGTAGVSAAGTASGTAGIAGASVAAASSSAGGAVSSVGLRLWQRASGGGSFAATSGCTSSVCKTGEAAEDCAAGVGAVESACQIIAFGRAEQFQADQRIDLLVLAGGGDLVGGLLGKHPGTHCNRDKYYVPG